MAEYVGPIEAVPGLILHNEIWYNRIAENLDYSQKTNVQQLILQSKPVTHHKKAKRHNICYAMGAPRTPSRQLGRCEMTECRTRSCSSQFARTV